MVAAFERTASLLRARVDGLAHTGLATFYVRQDEQVTQLRCSTGSVGRQELPFGGACVPVDDLAPIVAAFLTDEEPGVVRLTDDEPEEGAGEERVLPPFPVWVRAVGTTGHA
ncbi:hypothetical protein ACFZDG_17040 [Kitasatospora xanthocidica]|uniref:hypothetical protein n=1 Tax=Kitasatospora xanthocidica TaxID=83382 RepID=UPI0036E4A45D